VNAFRVLKPGPFSTIQDSGRVGYSHLGLTQGGPLDFRSFALANRLVGNNIDVSALEITLGGVELECLMQTTIALTGAFCPFTLNGKPKPLWQTHLVNPGDTVSIGFAALGVRAYLAVNGGFGGPKWFGSQATVVREKLGRPLAAQQILEANSCSWQPQQKLDFRAQPSLRKQATLDFVPGYQWEQLSSDAQQQLLNHTFTISKHNDRMGYQLEGASIETGSPTLESEGIAKGAIQITGDGKPIILMRDRQTIGGYPKAGSVTSQSLDILAQLTQGASIQFNAISAEQSVDALRRYQLDIETCPILEL